MIAGTIWRTALVIAALVTFGLQFDRQTRRTPVIAENVPELFRSAAQLPVAARALAGDDPAFALAEAQRLVARRPLPAEHLRVLAQAQFGAGQIEQSALSIQIAAQRGWRDPLAQESMLRLAIDAGDADEAARRYAALFLRRDTADALLEELGPAVLAEPGGEGRQTLITIVGGGERWHGQFLNRGARIMPPDAFAEIVTATTASGTHYDCQLLKRVERPVRSRDEAAADTLMAVIDGQC